MRLCYGLRPALSADGRGKPPLIFFCHRFHIPLLLFSLLLVAKLIRLIRLRGERRNEGKARTGRRVFELAGGERRLRVRAAPAGTARMILIARHFRARDSPDPARETLSVLFVSHAARRAPEPSTAKFQLNGGGGCKLEFCIAKLNTQTVFASGSCACASTRKGLEGCGAAAERRDGTSRSGEAGAR
jgi:hypothetical protein